jgi:hypothetical protein
MRILAIDPGNTESGYAVIDADTREPIHFGKITNHQFRKQITHGDFNRVDRVAIEMIESYGMAVGKEVFQTCVWIGRFMELCLDMFVEVDLEYRKDVKLHHCHSSKAKDANITQALIDRFASGVPNHGKGSKAEPGWFHGFHHDVWQSYALAVYVADTAAVDVRAGAGVRDE